MTVWVSYADPVYASADGAMINCQLTLEDGTVVPFTASKNDVEPYGVELYDTIIANQASIPIGPYVPPARN